MLEFVRGKTSERKLRLFSCACARRFWLLLPDAHTRAVVRVSERYADGLRSRKELDSVAEGASVGAFWLYTRARQPQSSPDSRAEIEATRIAQSTADPDAWSSAEGVLKYLAGSQHLSARATDAVQYVFDIFGDPFRKEWAPVFQWRDDTILELAQTVYQRRTYRSLPLLADALEDAGCTDAKLLGHLRSPGPHVRGCWAVDLVLGKS
jgi:hypothetical protein